MSARRPVGLIPLVLAAALVLAAGWCGLALALAGLERASEALESRAGLAHRQALLATRIETELARKAADPGHKASAVPGLLDRYRRALDAERRLPAIAAQQGLDDGSERADAARLAALIAAPPTPARLASASQLAASIARAELAEAEQATAATRAAWARLIRLMWAGLAGLAALAALAGWLVWRHIGRPLGALADAVEAVAREAGPVALPLAGPGEIHRLIAGVNHMAATVDAQVARRTVAIEAARQRLEAIDARRRLFLAKVGHELRTPLTALLAEAELARRGADAATTAALDSIADSGTFLGRRLDDLLALARAESGELALVMAPADLAAIARDAVRRTRRYADLCGVGLDAGALPTALPVQGDTDRLFQAIAAIIDNGIKFAGAGGHVTLAGAATAGMAEIRIGDTGPGVTAGEIAAMFEPHVQGAAGRSHGGSGLGLALAHWIITAHGGTIMATSGQEGLCVTMRVPLAP